MLISSLLLGALLLADPGAPSAGNDPVVVDISFEKSVLLIEELVDRPDGLDSPCSNDFLGGKRLDLVVVPFTGESGVETVVLADFPEEGPCPTPASVAAARDGTRAKLARWGLDPLEPRRPSVKAVGDKKGAAVHVEEVRSPRPKEQQEEVTRTARMGTTTLFETHAVFGNVNRNKTTVAWWLVEDGGRAALLERETSEAASQTFSVMHARGPIRLPANGVDVVALGRLQAHPACSISLAANADLIGSVAATFRDALPVKSPAPIAVAKAQRPSSVVYATPACTEHARALAQLIPGGARVEALTWESRAPVVVALGSTASPL